MRRSGRPPRRASVHGVPAAKRILLVDDEEMIRETLAASLEGSRLYRHGCRRWCRGAGIGPFSPVMIDVLVTDLSMPGIDGLAVIRQAQCERPGLPAVLLTGYAGHGAQTRRSANW